MQNAPRVVRDDLKPRHLDAELIPNGFGDLARRVKARKCLIDESFYVILQDCHS